MGLFDKIFTHKPSNQNTKVETPIELSKAIESILLILSNLSLMDKETIRSRIASNENYDDSIFQRLAIESPGNLDYLKKYYSKAKFGYGKNKIESLRKRLNAYVSEKLILGVTTIEIAQGLMIIVESEIENYKNVIVRFNESLKQAEEESKDYNEMIAMLDYWKTYYKEQELGYPIPLDKKVKDMAYALQNLPYNGYGDEEILKFTEAAKKMIEEAQLSNEDSQHTYNRIYTELYAPLNNKFLADVDALNKKLQMIDDSPYMSDFEKDRNKQRTINEFNISYGHVKEDNTTLEDMKKNLALLEYGGYGDEVIEQFAKQVETIISDGERIHKLEPEVKKDIQECYQRLLDNYEIRLVEMKNRLATVDLLNLTEKEKSQRKALIIEDFHDEMGLPIDYKERINAMILELKNLERGGYGELKIEEFKTKALERLSGAESRAEIRDALREIREAQDLLIKAYQEELRKLYDASDRVSHDRHLTDEEKQKTIEEFDREFKFKMGYRMNFTKYIDNRAEELRTLSGGGYGKEAIDEFVEEATAIATSTEEEKKKYDSIRQKFNALKKQYNTNLKTFKEWKRIQLLNAKDEDVTEESLNSKIAYMLSLSPKELQNYYLEDDRKKKEETDKHNYIAAFKFLARQEAKYKRNERIYNQRISDLEAGKTPYTKEEIEEATAELNILSLTDDSLAEDERTISVVEYIDSTLLRQMMYVEASLMNLNG